MTEILSTGDLVREFIDALTPASRAAICPGIGMDAGRVILLSAAARDHGWTPGELAAECNRNMVGVYRPSGLITDRLKRCAEGVTARPKPSMPKFVQPLDWCGSDLCQEAGRWRLDPDTLLPIGHCECWTEPS